MREQKFKDIFSHFAAMRFSLQSRTKPNLKKKQLITPVEFMPMSLNVTTSHLERP